MRRVQLNEFGPPEVLRLQEVHDPRPAERQVLIAVAFAGVTFVETQVRRGRPPWSGPLPRTPLYPGNAVEGTVLSVGTNVPATLVGSRVAAATGGSGGYSDRVVVDANAVIAIPAALAPGHAVALLADGRTAMSVLRAANVDRHTAVVITAAAGGVGTLLLQLAHNAGARSVIALAGGEHKRQLALSLGADVAIDYKQEGWQTSLRSAINEHGVDAILDGVGGEVGRAIFDAARPRTRICVFGMSSGTYTDASVRQIVERGITLVGGVQLSSPAESQVLSKAAFETAANGKLVAVIGQTFPLEEADRAHAAIERREVIGKTLLVCGPAEPPQET